MRTTDRDRQLGIYSGESRISIPEIVRHRLSQPQSKTTTVLFDGMGNEILNNWQFGSTSRSHQVHRPIVPDNNERRICNNRLDFLEQPFHRINLQEIRKFYFNDLVRSEFSE